MLVNCVVSGVVPLFGLTVHVVVIGCVGFVTVIVPQFIVMLLLFESFIVSFGLYVP